MLTLACLAVLKLYVLESLRVQIEIRGGPGTYLSSETQLHWTECHGTLSVPPGRQTDVCCSTRQCWVWCWLTQCGKGRTCWLARSTVLETDIRGEVRWSRRGQSEQSHCLTGHLSNAWSIQPNTCLRSNLAAEGFWNIWMSWPRNLMVSLPLPWKCGLEVHGVACGALYCNRVALCNLDLHTWPLESLIHHV